MNKLNLQGQRFGRLVALRSLSKFKGDRYRVFWVCLCDCGNTCEVESYNLRHQTKSCGCIHKEAISKVNYKHGGSIGYKECKEYGAWQGAKSRCFNKNDHKYKAYGARGITMCDKWKNDYSAFLQDMGRCPDGFSLDRINVDGNYEPSNCRWADIYTQSNNKRNHVFIELDGNRMTLSQFSRKFGFDYKRVHSLYKYKKLTVIEVINKLGGQYGSI